MFLLIFMSLMFGQGSNIIICIAALLGIDSYRTGRLIEQSWTDVAAFCERVKPYELYGRSCGLS